MSTNFRRGTDAAEEASKLSQGGKFSRLDYFTIKDEKDPTRIVRLITDADAWITTTMHPNMPTRPAPTGYTGKWPQAMGCVCRMDSYKGQRTFPQYHDCFHCITPQTDGKPRRKNERTWGIGILRQQNADGTFSDVMKEVEIAKDDGTKETRVEPHYVVFCQAWSNFRSTLDDHFKMRGTVLDRDWKITRKGFTMNDTDYGIVPFDPLMVLLPGTETPRVLDFRDAELLALYGDIPSLEEFVSNQASDDFYDRFFDVRRPQPAMTKDGAAAATGVASAATAVVTPATEPAHVVAVQSIADRISGVPGVQNVTGYGPQAAASAPVGLTSLPPQS